jgi:hypothetical protein
MKVQTARILILFVAGIIIFFSRSVCFSQTPSFASDANFSVESHLFSFAMKDLNADGHSDCVTVNAMGYNISVSLGNLNGTFGEAVGFGEEGATSLAMGDLNHDGKTDIATVNNMTTTMNVSVFLGNGDGTFGSVSNFYTGFILDSVTIGDVDGDGKLDLVTANDDVHSISVLLGNGDGTFGTAVGFGPGSGSGFYAVAMGDTNSDGTIDLITASVGSGELFMFLGNGNGTFRNPQVFNVGVNPISVAMGEMNADGKIDLVTANADTENVSVLLGNGNGTFGNVTNFRAGKISSEILIRSLNPDGKPDLPFILNNL